jgi:predicted DsbA family dithiol-disulfide isomerase
MALAGPRVRTEIIEATEFPDLVARYAVRGVPKTVINDRLVLDGAVPEADLWRAVEEAGRAQPPAGT